MKSKHQGLIEIYTAVLLFSISGLFGKLLSLPPLIIVFGRTFFASIVFIPVFLYTKQTPKINDHKDFYLFAILGIILAIHWAAFFHSIQISTVAVGLLTFSTFPLFVTFMEPCFFNEKPRFFDIIAAGLILTGLTVIVPSFDFENMMTRGAFWGMVSGFTFAVLSLLNKKYVTTHPPFVIAFYQNAFAALVLLPWALYGKFNLEFKDILLLDVLGVFCTALAHALFIKSLVYIKAQLAGIITGLEPVFGIILAVFLLGEIPALKTFWGGSLVLSTAVCATVMRGKHIEYTGRKKKKA